MEKTFAFVGSDAVGAVVAPRMETAGYRRVRDVAIAQTVITYCTTQTALEDAYFDEEGLVQSASKGTLLLDFSPSTPSFARELNAVAVVSDLVAVEAPLVFVDVARADALADRENVAAFVAGDEDAVAAALPVVELFAGDVQVTGGAGSAQLARAAYTLQTAAQIVSAIEADALYRAVRTAAPLFGGADVRVGAATPVAESVLEAVREGRFEGSFSLEMLMAELSAALTAADDAELILPQAEASLHLLELLAVIGGADKTPAALSLLYGDEKSCADAGLDWSRAESAYAAGMGYEDEDFDDFDEGLDYDYDDPDGLYPGYGYSEN